MTNVTNILLDVDSLKVLDYGRAKQPYELEINNVDVDSIPNRNYSVGPGIKKDVSGNELYVLPLPDQIVKNQVVTQTLTTVNTGYPVMQKKVTKVALLDPKGNQVSNVTYGPDTTIDKFDPNTGIMNPAYLVDDKQQYDSSGNALYLVPHTTLYWTTTEQQVQAQDSNKNPLFYLVEEVDSTITEQFKEITSSDPEYVVGLNHAVEPEAHISDDVPFSTRFQEFTYSDIVSAKEQQLLKGTLYGFCTLYEMFQENQFDLTNTVADFVVDKLSLPVAGKAIFHSITLPDTAGVVRILTETNISGITIKVNGTTVNSNNEVILSTATNSIVIEIDNPTGKRVDINSLAILS